MAFDVNAFVGDILKDVTVDENKKAALAEVLTNPAVAKRLEESTLRQGEFSKLASEYQGKIKKAQDYWESLVTADQNLQQERQLLKQKLAGEGIDLDNPPNGNGTGVTKKELEQLAQQAIAYQNAVTKLAMGHYKEFGEILDTDELLKVSAENGNININLAYDRMVTPKREEIQKTDFKKQLELARKEGAEEALKNATMPTSDNPINVSPNLALDALSKDAATVKSEYGSMAAIRAWKDARSRGTPIPSF